MPQLPEKLSFDETGGDKTDYVAVVDSTTDRSAAEINSAFCASAQMTRTAVRACVKFSPTTQTVLAWDAVWKGATASIPVVLLDDPGTFIVQFPSTVLDEQGNSHSVNLQFPWANVECTPPGAFYTATAAITDSNEVLIYVWDDTFTKTTPLEDYSINLFVI